MSSPPPYPEQPGTPQQPDQQARQQQTWQQSAPEHAPPPRRPRNGVGVAALVFGILGLLGAVFVIGGLLGLVAVALGIVGIVRVSKGTATNRGVAITGLVLGLLSVLASIALVILVFVVFANLGGTELVECVQRSGGGPAAMEQCRAAFEEGLRQRGYPIQS